MQPREECCQDDGDFGEDHVFLFLKLENFFYKTDTFESWCFSSVVLQVLCFKKKKKIEEEETVAAPVLELPSEETEVSVSSRLLFEFPLHFIRQSDILRTTK